MAVSITPENVAAFAPGIDLAQVEELLSPVLLLRPSLLPCLSRCDPDSNTAKAAVFILSGAIARMVGATAAPKRVTQQSAGPFSMSMPVVVATFSDKETKALRALCGGNKAFALDTIPHRARRDPCPDFGALPLPYGQPRQVADFGQSLVDEAPAGCGGHLPWCDTMADVGCTCGWADQ